MTIPNLFSRREGGALRVLLVEDNPDRQRILSMTIRDSFNNWEGIAALIARNGLTVLTSNGGAVPPNEGRFIRIVEATVEERTTLEETAYRLEDAQCGTRSTPVSGRRWRPLVAGPGAFFRKRHPAQP